MQKSCVYAQRVFFELPTTKKAIPDLDLLVQMKTIELVPSRDHIHLIQIVIEITILKRTNCLDQHFHREIKFKRYNMTYGLTFFFLAGANLHKQNKHGKDEVGCRNVASVL